MSQELDSLSIRISADAEKAVKSIDALIKSINGLSTAVSDVDVSNIANLSKVLSKTSNSLSSIGSQRNAVKTLRDIGKALGSIADSTKKIDAFVQAFGEVQNATSSTSQAVKNMASSISDSFKPPAVIKTMTTELSNLGYSFNEILGKILNFKSETTSMSVNVDTSSIDVFESQMDDLVEYIVEIKGLLGSNGISGLLTGTVANPSTGFEDIPYAEFRELNEEFGRTNIRAEEAASGVEDLSAQITKATHDGLRIRNLQQQFAELSKPLKNSEVSLNGLQRAMVNMKVMIPTGNLLEVQKRIKSVKEEYERLRDSINQRINSGSVIDERAFEADIAKLQALRNEYDRLIQKQTELARSGGYKAQSPDFSGFKATLRDVGKMLDSVWSKIKSFSRLIVSGFSSAISTVKKLGKAFLDVARHSRTASRSSNKLPKVLNNIIKPLTRIFKMLRLMITRKILQAIIKNAITGFKNVIQYSSEVDANVSLLWNSLRQLGNATGSMVTPLLNAFAPAINQIIQALIEAINWANQLFATLTGASTWIRAKKLTDSYAKSLDESKKSADKLKKSVMGFDELNQLTDNNKSGTDVSDMFETVEVDENIKKISDWLKSMYDLADFYDLGAKLGEKFKKWLDSIPWNRIRKQLNNIGKSLATLVNGFVEVDGLGRSIGNTVAQGLNSVFEFVNGFVHNLKWDSVGKFIADTFNGFFEGIDWELIKDTVITGIKGVSTAINSFVANFNWDNISNTISNLVNILVEAVKTFFKDTNFGELGTKLGEQLRLTIEKIDWENAGKSLGSVINAAIEFASSFISEQSFSSISLAFTTFVNGLKDELGIDSFYDVINSLTEGIKKFFEDVNWTDLGSRVGEKIKEALQKIDFVTLGQTLGTILQGAFNFFKAMLTPEFFGEVKQAIQDLFKGFFETIDKEDLAKAIAIVLGACLTLSIGKTLLVKGVSELGTKILCAIFGSTAIATVTSAIAAVLVPAILGVAIGSLMGDLITKLSFGWGADIASYFGNKEAEERLRALEQEYGQFGGAFKMLVDDFQGNGIALRDESGNIVKTFDKDFNEVITIIDDTNEHAKTAFGNESELLNQVQSSGKAISGVAKDISDGYKKATDDVKGTSIVFADENGKIVKTVDSTGNAVITFGNTTSSASSTMASSYSNTSKSVKDSLSGIADASKNATIKINDDSKSYKTAIESNASSTKSANDEIKVSYTNVKAEVANSTNVMTGSLNTLTKSVKDNSSDIKSTTDDVKESFNKDKWTLDGVKEGLKASFEGAIKSIKEIWNSFADWFNKIEIKIDPIEVAGKTIFDGAEFSLFKLPKFADGGFPGNSGQLFIGNENGIEMMGRMGNRNVVANNQQIVDGIKQGVYEAVAMAMSTSSSNSGSSYINNTIQIDGETIARAVTKGQKSIDRRYNPSLA